VKRDKQKGGREGRLSLRSIRLNLFFDSLRLFFHVPVESHDAESEEDDQRNFGEHLFAPRMTESNE